MWTYYILFWLDVKCARFSLGSGKLYVFHSCVQWVVKFWAISIYKVISATTKIILATEEVIIAILNIISATTKVILATEEVNYVHILLLKLECCVVYFVKLAKT